MLSHLEMLKQINDLNIADFADPLPWWSVKETGQIHASKQCATLTRHKFAARSTSGMGNINETGMTLKQALATKMVCENCERDRSGWTDEQNGVLIDAYGLGQILDETRILALVGRESVWQPHLRNWRNRNAAQHIQQKLGNSTWGNELDAWKTQIANSLTKYMVAPVDGDKLQREVLHRSAASTLAIQINMAIKDDMQPATPREQQKATAVRQLADTWIALIAENHTPADASELVLANLTKLGDGTKEPARQITRTLVQTMVTTWTDEYEALVAPAAVVLVGARVLTQQELAVHGYARNVGEAILSTLDWVVHNGHGAATCHPTVSAYIFSLPWVQATNNFEQHVAINDMVTKDKLFDTLTLWEPGTQAAVYYKLGDAYKAVSSL